MNSKLNNLTLTDSNMATNGCREFHGLPQDNPAIWIRDILLISRFSSYTPDETLKTIIFKLRGDDALSWASEIMEERNYGISFEEFINLFKKRFTDGYTAEFTLSNFLTTPTPSTIGEYYALIKNGTLLFKQNLMNTAAITQVLISKSPDTIKSLLFQATEQAPNW